MKCKEKQGGLLPYSTHHPREGDLQSYLPPSLKLAIPIHPLSVGGRGCALVRLSLFSAPHTDTETEICHKFLSNI